MTSADISLPGGVFSNVYTSDLERRSFEQTPDVNMDISVTDISSCSKYYSCADIHLVLTFFVIQQVKKLVCMPGGLLQSRSDLLFNMAVYKILNNNIIIKL